MYVKQRVRSVERVNTSGLFKATNTFLPGGERRGAESNTENDKKKRWLCSRGESTTTVCD